jgi:hypothetical protein
MGSRNKSLALRFIEFASLKNISVLDEIAHPEYIMHDNMVSKTLEEHKESVKPHLNAWDLLEYSVEDIIEEDNKIALRWKWKGKMVGNPDTHHLSGIWLFEIENELIKTIWSTWDQSVFGDM